MKRTVIPVVIFLVAGGIGGSPKPQLPTESSSYVTTKSSAPSITAKTNTVSYKGVRFTYDSSLAQEVESETIRAVVEGKPSDIVPEHLHFMFVGYRIPKGQPFGYREISVFSVAKFREAVASASREDAKHVVYPQNLPNWTVYFDEEVRVLKALIKTKPPQANVGRFLAKARGKQGCRAAMPFLPMWEGCQAFVGQVRYVNFKKGRGVFFLTQWDRETTQVTNEGLNYAFQGITDDGQYYVSAAFSVTAPFLPTGDEPEVLAWNTRNYLLSHSSMKYQDYLRPVLGKLNAMPRNEFQPNLGLLDQLIQSLEVQSE